MTLFKKSLRYSLASALLFVHLAGRAAVNYLDLGTAAPPASLSSYTMQPFGTAPQAAIGDLTPVVAIPGNPLAGALTLSAAMNKQTVPAGGWNTWSHGFTGPVFVLIPGLTVTLTLPPNTGAFYLYVEPNNIAFFNVQATTDSGTTSGPVAVSGLAGARGFGFYTTAGEAITSINVTVPVGADGFAIGEFGIASNQVAANVSGIPTLSEWAMFVMSLLIALSGALHMRKTKRTD